MKKNLFIVFVLFVFISCDEECYEKKGELEPIDLTHLKPKGFYVQNPEYNKSQKLRFIDNSTAIISFESGGKKIEMTYKITTGGTYETAQTKY